MRLKPTFRILTGSLPTGAGLRFSVRLAISTGTRQESLAEQRIELLCAEMPVSCNMLADRLTLLGFL